VKVARIIEEKKRMKKRNGNLKIKINNAKGEER